MQPQGPLSIRTCFLVAVMLTVTAVTAQAQQLPTASSTAAKAPEPVSQLSEHLTEI